MSETAVVVSPAESREIRLFEEMERIEVDQATGLPMVKTMAQQVAVAAWAQQSGLLPDTIKTKAQAWMVMQRGVELGFPGLTAFEFLFPVNGKVRLTPDGAKAKALASNLLEDFREQTEGEGDALVARVTVKRRGIPSPIVAEFSLQDAKVAGLLGKDNWRKYPKRMCLARARGFAFGDGFRDVVGGLQVREMFDLDPGEKVGFVEEATIVREAAQAPKPPAEDPLDAVLTGSAPVAEPAKEEPAPEPPAEPVELHQAADVEVPSEDAPPFQSNAEADAAIAASEAKKETCSHESLAPWLARGTDTGKPLLCPDCNAPVKPNRKARG